MGGFQLPWTDDLILSARCKEGDRVLDVACGTARVNTTSNVKCRITGIDLNKHMLNVARQEPAIDWHLGDVSAMPSQIWLSTWCCANRGEALTEC